MNPSVGVALLDRFNWAIRRVAQSGLPWALLAALLLGPPVVLFSAAPAEATSTTVTFSHTGGQQSWTVPVGVTSVQVDAQGAQGGSAGGGFSDGGAGGRVRASIPVTAGQVIFIYVGGNGGLYGTAYNGGGAGWRQGGGASDVRIGGTTLASRVVVAGGGGGVGLNGSTSNGGGGGGGDASGAEAGQPGTCGASAGGAGTSGAGGAGGSGTVSNGTAGALGVGGSGNSYGGGGGGGYYGGGGGGACTTGNSTSNAGGGGATSYASASATSVQQWRSVRLGDGTVTLTWPPDTSTAVPAVPGSTAFSVVGIGAQQSWTVPAGVTSVQVDALGASGGSSGAPGGQGGRVVATVPVTPGQVLFIYVGGNGGLYGSAFNGGGAGWRQGGGASDVRIGGTTLAARVVVAGGGGGVAWGSSTSLGQGGAGGDRTAALAGAGGDCGATAGGGATAAAGGGGGTGSAGNGTAGISGQGGSGGYYAGGGGGGFYGGGGGGTCNPNGMTNGGGGGGTNYTSPSASQVLDEQGVRSGDGSVTIAWPDFVAVGGAIMPMERRATNPSSNYRPRCHCDPVNTATGSLEESVTDLALPGRGAPLVYTRAYSSLSAATLGRMGYGWTDSYAMSLTLGTGSPPATVTVNQENGTQVSFTWSGTAYTAAPRVLAGLVRNGDGSFTFTRRARERFGFSSSGQLTSLKDLNNYTTALVYDGSGRLTTVTDPAGRTLTLAYNAAQLVQSVSDSTTPSRSVTYTYDGAQNLTDVIDVRGGHAQLSYDASHRLLTMRSARFFGDTTTSPSPVTTNHYDTNGRVDSQSDPIGRTTTFAYSDYATTVTDPKGYVTVEHYRHGVLVGETRGFGTAQAATWIYGYDASTLGVTSVTDPLGHASTATYDAAGNKLTSVDPLGRTTTFTYDSLNDLTSVSDPMSVTTTNTYDSAGNRLTESTPLVGSSPAVSRVLTYTYGDASHPGDVTSITDPRSKTTTYTFDGYGNPLSATSPLGDKTSATFNARGDRLTMISPKGNVTGGVPADYTTTWTYNSAGQVLTATDPNTHTTSATYDADGNPATVTDANSRTTTNTFDPAGQLLTVLRPDTTTRTSTFDGVGNLLVETDGASHTTTWTYANAAFPHNPATVTDALGRAITYGYDAAGQQTTKQDSGGDCSAVPKVSCTTYTSDAAGQVSSVSYSDGVTPNVTLGYDLDGRRTSMIDGTGTSGWVFDSLGRMTSSTNGAGVAVAYAWDLAGNKTSVIYPGGRTVTRHFDDAGRMDSLTDWLTNTTSFGYDHDSNLTTNTFPSGTTNVDTFGFDKAGALSSVVAKKNTTTLASLSYGRDNANQVTSASSTGLGESAQTWTYSPLEQLASANASNYSYDAGDNLVGLSSGATQGFDVANQLCWRKVTSASGTCTSPPTGATIYGSDTRGNRTTVTPSGGGTTTLAYDQANRLTSFGTAGSYTYNGDGLRMTKTVGGATTSFAWDEAGELPLLLLGGTTAYLYGPDNRVLEQVPDAPISLVGTGSAANATLTTAAVTLPGGVLANDQILLGATYPANRTVTTPAGYTLVGAWQTGSTNQHTKMSVFRKTASGGEASVTVTFSAVVDKAVVAGVYRGVNPTTPIQVSSNATSTSSSVVLPSVSPTLANEQLVAFVGATQGATSGAVWTAPAGMTKRVEASVNLSDGAINDQALGASGATGTRTVTYGGTGKLVGALLALAPAAPQVLWYHHDQLGSTRMLTDALGASVATFNYDPHGNATTSTGSVTTPLGWAGEYRDTESGLVYLRARHFDTLTGQFLSRDPLESVTREAYGYVANNPLNGSDPSGLLKLSSVIKVVAAVTVGVVVGAVAVAAAPVEAVVLVGGGVVVLGAGAAAVGGAIVGTAATYVTYRAFGGLESCVHAARRADDLPAQNQPPDSTSARDDGNGNGQIRDYGPDGRATTDYDFGHDHDGSGNPHAHDWDWNRTPPRQGPRPIRSGE